jgi:ADP-heptose:LPS heptosyltransferase
VTFLAELSVVQVAQRLAAAAAFVGNDSGPTHLAAMLGLPTVALFGGGDAAVFGPLGPRVMVLQGDRGELAAITPEQVAAVVPR